MIVLHDQKLIFIKPWKVAGTSFEIALSKFASEADIVTTIPAKDENIRKNLGFVGPQNDTRPAWGLVARGRCRFVGAALRSESVTRFTEHQSAYSIRRRLERNWWYNYTKLSIVRDPWDMAVSTYFWRHGNEKNKEGRPLAPFEQWCVENEALFAAARKQYLIRGKPIIDRFIRYEQFEADVKKLECEKPQLAGLHAVFSSIKAKSG